MKRSGAPGLRSRGRYRTKERDFPSTVPKLRDRLPVVSGGAAMAENAGQSSASAAVAAKKEDFIDAPLNETLVNYSMSSTVPPTGSPQMRLASSPVNGGGKSGRDGRSRRGRKMMA